MSVLFNSESKVLFLHHSKELALKGGIAKGCVIGLQGPSGCGKSTLLRSLAQTEVGSVPYQLDSVEVSALSAAHRRVSLVFQKPLLFPHLSALENIEFPMRFVSPWKSWSAELSKKRALVHLREFSLESLANALPRQLSGGEAMRVSLLRGLVTEPRFLLLDEPFSGLDKETKEKVKSWLKEKIVTLQIPTLLVSHLEEDLQSFADRRLNWPSEENFLLDFS